MAFRHSFFIFLCLSIFNSCRKEPESIPEPVEEQAIETSVPSLSKYSGFWLSESYVNAIKNLKSVDSATFVQKSMAIGFRIIPDTISNKSALLNVLWHSEGSTERVYADDNQMLYFNPPRPDYPLKHFIIGLKNNKMELEFPDTGKKEYYLRYENQYQALNQLLFAGKYRDAITNVAIELTEGGKVSGIPDVITYNPVFQFDESNIEGVDVLFFYNGEKRSEKMGYDYQLAYQYKFEGDTLKLYEVPEDYGIEPGPLKYKLVKR
ncbi:hypothetical protein [Flavobacterium sp.]|uniref:hypothetical protein n=2 Tax=Flavobacterium sp. TaxID=239 RepID=UPI00403354A4